MRRILICIAVWGAWSLSAPECWALAQETIGNEPLNAANYREWPTLMPVINHASRVYSIWVNGHETFYYDGATADLNACLKLFAETDAKEHEVLIRPAFAPACSVKSFDGRAIAYHWEMELIGGIAGHMTREHPGVESPYPVLTVYVDDMMTLQNIQIPKGVQLLELADMKMRYSLALSSQDKEVRGRGAERFARLDPYDAKSLSQIAQLLGDEDPWVRRCAIGAVGRFGSKAQGYIPNLEEIVKNGDENEKKSAEETIQKIRSAQSEPEHEARHLELQEAIHERMGQWKAE